MHPDIDMKKEWGKSISHEISFWENWFKNKGGRWKEDYKMRLSPDSRLQELFLKYLNKDILENKILDVGAGPLTIINKKCDFTKLYIYAVDPLANEYDSLLKKYNIQPIVRTQKSDGERLTEKFNDNNFDITYSRNALDHSYNPLKCIEEMVKVTKSGGYIILQHFLNEGSHKWYRGMHKWDFFVKNNSLFLKGKNTIEYNIPDYFKNIIKPMDISIEKRMITTIFKKL